ncbi:MAG TPA: YjcZ family sporulation protein [Candidatus Pseudogracilibacillus intestinigallinarum]|uniref:YjcZ family sporulation protein n=1 Tax=Candidatus Pseudogracilibacillus intestinigallinarum TaxID=2838742 RepID=A0A9D1TK58_9BACI|nr:YjcZ family sporulation protein [Candidatus Pseudogracilibacillus intestinigallinarum]
MNFSEKERSFVGHSYEGGYRRFGGGYALILVLFILLVIVGAAWL